MKTPRWVFALPLFWLPGIGPALVPHASQATTTPSPSPALPDSIPGLSIQTEPASLTVTADRAPPTLISVASVLPGTAGLQFNEYLDPASVLSPLNYFVTGANVLSARLQPDGRSVLLQLDRPLSILQVVASNVQDLAGNIILPHTAVRGRLWALNSVVGPDFASSAFSGREGAVDLLAGGLEIGGPTDSFHFVYAERTNDFDVRIRIERFEPNNPAAQAGLMARNNLSPESASISVLSTPPGSAGLYQAILRPRPAAPSIDWGPRPASLLPNPWLRLRRLGDVFSAYYSRDGYTWDQYAQTLIPPGQNGELASVLLVGMAASSHAGAELAQVKFRNFTFSSFPVVIDQPQSQKVEPGATVTLAVTAGGTAPLAYQWRRNGVNIPGATNSTLTITNVNPQDGGDYTVVVLGPEGVTQSDVAKLTVVQSQPVQLNDQFGSGPIVATSFGLASADNTNATFEPGEPPHAGRRGGKSVWLTWQAPFTGLVFFTTRGSSFDTLLAAYTGIKVDQLTPIAADEDSGGFGTSLIRFNAVAGQVYHIAVDGLGGAVGDIVLGWQLRQGLTVPLLYEQPLSRVVRLDQSAALYVQASGAASVQWFHNGIPIPGATDPVLLVPKVSPAEVGSYVARLLAPDLAQYVDSEIAVLEIGPFDRFRSYDKFQSLYFPPLAGGGSGGGGSPPAGIPVTAGTIYSQILNNSGSGTEPGEPIHCERLTGSTRWFGPLYVTTNDMLLEIDTVGSAIDTILAAYTGSNLLTLSNVACAAGPGSSSTIRFSAFSDVLYNVTVDGTNGAQGTIVLNWKLGTIPAFSIIPSNQMACLSNTVVFCAAANAVPAAAYQWYSNGVPILNANSTNLILTNIQSTHAGQYSVLASNFMGTTTASAHLAILTPVQLGFAPIQTNTGYALLLRCPTNSLATQHYVIEATVQFDSWVPLYTNGCPGFLTNFLDPDWPSYPRRFYRLSPWLP